MRSCDCLVFISPQSSFKMKTKMDKLKTLEGANVENLFLPTMAEHHKQAIAKAQQCISTAQKDELSRLHFHLFRAHQH